MAKSTKSKETKARKKRSEKLRNELEALRSENKSLRSENKALRRNNKDLMNKNEKLELNCNNLKNERDLLKRANKSLTQRLATSKAKVAQYRAEERKRATECGAKSESIRVNNEHVERHHFSTMTIILATELFSRLNIGSRQVVKVFEILHEVCGEIFEEVPAYTTIIYWAERLGLSAYKDTHKKFADKEYALIVDESMMIGSEKLLLTLAVPAEHNGAAITEKDTTIVDISVGKSWNGEKIKEVLEKVSAKIGHEPEYVISDNGSTIRKAVREAGYKHHLDISHSLAMFLERVYKKETDFQELSEKVQMAQLKYNMQEVAYLQPPSQRAIARFMNMSRCSRWLSRMQFVYHKFPDNVKRIYEFIPRNASLINELSEVMDCITRIEKDVKTNGMSNEVGCRCRQLVVRTLMCGNERQRKLGAYILEYFDRELSFVNGNACHNASSDPVESAFGVIKSRMPDNKLVGVSPIILIMPLRFSLANHDARPKFDFKGRLERGRHCHLKEWKDENLSPNLAVKRSKTIGKRCVGF